MKRSYPVLGFTLLAICGLVAWGSTRANDDELPDATTPPAELSDVRELIGRIEALEKRLAELEKRDAPVRQADNRDEQDVTAPKSIWKNRADSDPRFEDDDASQNTNGQKWSIRLLGHRR